MGETGVSSQCPESAEEERGQDAQEAGGQMRSAKEGDFICKVMGTCEGFKQDSDSSRVLARSSF